MFLNVSQQYVQMCFFLSEMLKHCVVVFMVDVNKERHKKQRKEAGKDKKKKQICTGCTRECIQSPDVESRREKMAKN